jgi:hypothetical protein
MVSLRGKSLAGVEQKIAKIAKERRKRNADGR